MNEKNSKKSSKQVSEEQILLSMCKETIAIDEVSFHFQFEGKGARYTRVGKHIRFCIKEKSSPNSIDGSNVGKGISSTHEALNLMMR